MDLRHHEWAIHETGSDVDTKNGPLYKQEQLYAAHCFRVVVGGKDPSPVLE
jgi:hypothetical protein